MTTLGMNGVIPLSLTLHGVAFQQRNSPLTQTQVSSSTHVKQAHETGKISNVNQLPSGSKSSSLVMAFQPEDFLLF